MREAVATPDPGTALFDYRDPVTGTAGFLAYDGAHNRLAAGGFRVQSGLRADTVVQLAQAMTRKQQLLGLAVDGAKCGIDLDPRDPGKREAMRRFLRFLRPHLLERLSMGPDMGTSWSEIEELAREEGLPTVKIAIARAQGLPEREVCARLALLDTTLDGLTLGQRRAGHGLAHAALAALQRTRWPGDRPRVTVQGFGTLGRAATLSLADAGVRVVAVADEYGVVLDQAGLDLTRLLATAPGMPIRSAAPRRAADREAIFEAHADLLVLAACEDAMPTEVAHALPDPVRVVAVGANLGLAAPVEALLERRGVTVVPDFVAGCGGSASMAALFGPAARPTGTEFLDRLGNTMRDVVCRVLQRADAGGMSPRAAALALCAEHRPARSTRPY